MFALSYEPPTPGENRTFFTPLTWLSVPVIALSARADTVPLWHDEHLYDATCAAWLLVAIGLQEVRFPPWQYVQSTVRAELSPHTAGLTSGAPPLPSLWQ